MALHGTSSASIHQTIPHKSASKESSVKITILEFSNMNVLSRTLVYYCIPLGSKLGDRRSQFVQDCV